MDGDADQEIDDAGDQDAGESQALVVARSALDGKHRADECERAAEIAGHLAPCDEQEYQSPDAAEEDDRVRVEPEDQRDQDCGPEHGHHVLDAEEDRLRPR